MCEECVGETLDAGGIVETTWKSASKRELLTMNAVEGLGKRKTALSKPTV